MQSCTNFISFIYNLNVCASKGPFKIIKKKIQSLYITNLLRYSVSQLMMKQEQDINDLAFEANIWRISPTSTNIRAYIDANESALSKTDNEVAKITICTLVRSVQFPNAAISSTAENIFDYSRNKRTPELKSANGRAIIIRARLKTIRRVWHIRCKLHFFAGFFALFVFCNQSLKYVNGARLIEGFNPDITSRDRFSASFYRGENKK